MMEQSTRGYAAWAAVTLASIFALAIVFASAASAQSSDHGASFAVRCTFSHRDPVDPIVFPYPPGNPPDNQNDAHSHDFFGNSSTQYNSTYDGTEEGSVSMIGQPTTCSRPQDTAAYWLPTMSWNGTQLASNRAVFYYRAGGKDYKKVKPFPAGLKIIAGAEKRVTWRCGDTDKGRGTQNPPSHCDGPDPELGVRIIFPDCVAVARDGQPLLDSQDHKSHMAYSRPIDGKVRCPRSFPRSVPVLTMNVTFGLPSTDGQVTLSSGPASSMHADFVNAWDQGELNRLVVSCINQVPPSKPRPADCKAPSL